MDTIKTAKRLNVFGEYVFSKLGKVIKKVEITSRRKVLNFGPGDPDVAPSKSYIDKLYQFIKEPDAHLYPDFGANEYFSKALIHWYKERFNVVLDKNELFPLLGGKDGVGHLPLALLDEGDEILVPDPGYPAFSDPALMVGAKPIYYDLTEENGFKINLTNLSKKVSSKTKFIWLNFPANPTGQVITLEDLAEIVAFAKRHGLIIIYDNAYSEITFDGFKAPSILEIKGAKDIACEIGTFSKTFSFAGFRIGWIVGNGEVIAALAKVKSQMDSGLSTPLQKLGAFALTNLDKVWYENMIDIYRRKRDIIAGNIKKIGLKFELPKGGLYIWAKIPEKEKSSEEFCMQLLKKRQIFLTPGTAFGKNGERFVRVSICANIDGIERYF